MMMITSNKMTKPITPKEPISPSSIENDDLSDSLLCLHFNQDGRCLAVGTARGFRICNTSLPLMETLTFRRTFVHPTNNNDVKNVTDVAIGEVCCGNDDADTTDISDSGSSTCKSEDTNTNSINNTSSNNEPSAENNEQKSKSATNDNAHKEKTSLQNNNNPTPKTGSNSFCIGGIGKIEMLFGCSLLALVGDGTSPQFQKNKVLIWDDHLGRIHGEISFRHPVLAVKLRRDRICIALKDAICIYNFCNLTLLDTIDTSACPNLLGLLSISTDAGFSIDVDAGSKQYGPGIQDVGMVLACPSDQNGQVRVVWYKSQKQTFLVNAHRSALASISLTVDGSYLTTASERGTIIRLFSTTVENGYDSSTPLREFKRGNNQAKIESLSFSLDKSWLACASSKGTVHVLQVNENEDKDEDKNKKNSSYILATEKRTKSIVQVRGMAHPKACAFVPDRPHTIAVAGLDNVGNGFLLLASFGQVGTESGSNSAESTTNRNQRIGSDNTTHDCNRNSVESYAKEGEAQQLAFHQIFTKG